MVHGQVCQHFAVELNVLCIEGSHKFRIRHAVLSGAGIDALNPQGAEVALLLASVAVLVLESLFEGIFGYGIDVFAPSEITFCLFEYFFPSGSGSDGIG